MNVIMQQNYAYAWWPPAYGNYKGYQIHHVLWSLSNTIKVSGYVYFYIIL